MKEMATKKAKKTYPKYTDHSYLFWLIIPAVMIWLSLGYVIGFVQDKSTWSGKGNAPVDESKNVPYFREHGSSFVNLDQPLITLWFDDAWLSQYMVAYPILKTYDFTGTIAVPVNAVETNDYVNWAQLRVLQKDGWEITDHSLAHDCKMNEWDSEKVIYEYKTSKLILWKNGLTADIFVTPCGVDSETMRNEANKMFIGYRTVDPGYNDPNNFDVYNLMVRSVDNNTTIDDVKSWIDDTKDESLWTIIVFHKVGETSSEPEDEKYNTPLDEFREIIDYINESGIKVVIPSQVIASKNL